MHKKVKWIAFLKSHRKPENASSPEMLRMPRRGHHVLRYSSFKQPCFSFNRHRGSFSNVQLLQSLQGSTTACCLCQPTQWLHNVDILFMRPFPFWEEADKILFFSRPLVTDCACACVCGWVCMRVCTTNCFKIHYRQDWKNWRDLKFNVSTCLFLVFSPQKFSDIPLNRALTAWKHTDIKQG